MKNKDFYIGNVKLENNLLLAPIAGYSDAGMRMLCREYGASLAFTEMISAKGLYYNNKRTKDLLFTYLEEDPIGVQLFGNDPDIIAHAVTMKELQKFSIIDINIGCPAPKIIKNFEGSSLMKNPHKVFDIISSAKKVAGNKPITAKIRAGFSKDNINAVEVALAVEEAGGAAVTVHGRTRDMFYGGKVDLEVIKSVKDSVNIPVIGNGDIVDWQSYKRMIDYCKVDLVMIARGAIGRPYIFSQLLQRKYDFNVLDAIKKHISYLSFLPQHIIVNNMRKQIAYYVKGLADNRKIKERVYKASTIDELLQALS